MVLISNVNFSVIQRDEFEVVEELEMKHYKSWSGLNNQLNECLCDSLRNRVSYFLTRYHKVHNSYGRASIKLDGNKRIRTHVMLVFFA